MDLLIDMSLVGGTIVALTAFMGVIANAIGENIFGRKHRTYFRDRSKRITVGWNAVGGNNKKRVKFY